MVAILAAPLALWAALPALQFCHFDWDQVRLECFVAMSAVDMGGMANAKITDHTGHRAHPVAPATESPAAQCGGESGCPYAAARHPDPIAYGSCSRVDAPTGNSRSHHRAYCLGGPNGGAGVRPHAPRLIVQGPPPLVLAVSTALANPPRQIRRVTPQLAVRPPPRFWIRRPPVRGPPCA
jgi:hypothetical protein